MWLIVGTILDFRVPKKTVEFQRGIDFSYLRAQKLFPYNSNISTKLYHQPNGSLSTEQKQKQCKSFRMDSDH